MLTLLGEETGSGLGLAADIKAAYATSMAQNSIAKLFKHNIYP
jgi:hydroxymethylpyrimidine/phosphomethylpyrimidine kinase